MKTKAVFFIAALYLMPIHAGTRGLYQDVNTWTGHVYLAITGDSISGGGGACGQGITVFPNALTNAGARFSITNASQGGAHWWPNTNGVPDGVDQFNTVAPLCPRIVMCHFGRNDLLSLFPQDPYPDWWNNVVSNQVYQIWTNCQNIRAILCLSEILPAYTNYQEAFITSIHGFNGAYASFCATHSNCFVDVIHDAYGIWNTNTMGYDNINPLYACSFFTNNDDELHITPASFTNVWSPLLYSNLGNFFPDPPAMAVGTLTVQQLQIK